MLPTLLLALLPAGDGLVDTHHFPGPVYGDTTVVDTAWLAEQGVYAVVQDTVTGTGDVAVSLSLLSASGSPLGPADTLMTFPPSVELTAGPAVTDVLGGSGMLVTVAYRTPSQSIVLTLWIDPDGELSDFYPDGELGWGVVDLDIWQHPTTVYAVDVGGGDGYYPDQEVGLATVAIADELGDVWAWLPLLYTDSRSMTMSMPTWLDGDAETFDGFPSVPRTRHHCVVWQRGSGYDADIVARTKASSNWGPRVDVLATPGVGETRPSAGGAGEELAVAAHVYYPEADVERIEAVTLGWLEDGPAWSPLIDRVSLQVAPPDTILSPPSVGMTSPDCYVVGVQRSSPSSSRIALLPRSGTDFAHEGGIWIAEPHLTDPRVSEHPASPAGVALAVWTGNVAGSPDVEAVGARVRGCE